MIEAIETVLDLEALLGAITATTLIAFGIGLQLLRTQLPPDDYEDYD